MMSESLSHPNNTSNDFNTVEIYCVAKGYHECTFQVEIGERFVTMQKNSTKGRAFKILNDRGQLGHLERELVEWCFPRMGCLCFFFEALMLENLFKKQEKCVIFLDYLA